MLKSCCSMLALIQSCLVFAGNDPKPGVFILPYPLCHEVDNQGAKENLCVQVSPVASTKEGRSYVEDSDCKVVKKQRPFTAIPAPQHGSPDDPRLQDQHFMREMNWVKEQIRASACACCHDTKTSENYGLWDVNAPNVWVEQFTSRGITMMSGDLSTALIGVYPKDQNFGFDRSKTAAPTTDVARMKAFFSNEVRRRGLSQEDIAQLPSGNGSLEAAAQLKAIPCPEGVGLDVQGLVTWGAVPLRYIYITTPEAKNPLLPPNLDLPDGTIWRLDVRMSSDPLTTALHYGETPEGTLQNFPAQKAPEALVQGVNYRLFGMRDLGRKASVNCIFTAPATITAQP